MKAAHLAAEDRPDMMIKPYEISDIRYADGVSPTLLERRTWNLLINAAAGDAWCPDKLHQIKKRELAGGWGIDPEPQKKGRKRVVSGGKHISTDKIASALAGLQKSLIEIKVYSPNNKPAVLTTALLSSTIQELANDDDSVVFFRFTPELTALLKDSRYYVELEKLVFLSFQSKYSFPLYERGIRKLREKVAVDTIKVEDIRAILGVEKGSLERWPDLRRYAVDAAVSEVNFLAPFYVLIAPVIDRTQRNKPVVAVRFTYSMKDILGKAEAQVALAKPKIGRAEPRSKVNARIKEASEAESDAIRDSLPKSKTDLAAEYLKKMNADDLEEWFEVAHQNGAPRCVVSDVGKWAFYVIDELVTAGVIAD